MSTYSNNLIKYVVLQLLLNRSARFANRNKSVKYLPKKDRFKSCLIFNPYYLKQYNQGRNLMVRKPLEGRLLYVGVTGTKSDLHRQYLTLKRKKQFFLKRGGLKYIWSRFISSKAYINSRYKVKRYRFHVLRQLNQISISKLGRAPIKLIGINYAQALKLSHLHALGMQLLRIFQCFKRVRVTALIGAAILSCIRFKDARILNTQVVRSFAQFHYTKHKNIFYSWKRIIIGTIKKYVIHYKFGGIKLEFRGKLGVGGNAKKRVYCYTLGLTSNSSKIVKTYRSQMYVKTRTGVFASNLSIFF